MKISFVTLMVVSFYTMVYTMVYFSIKHSLQLLVEGLKSGRRPSLRYEQSNLSLLSAEKDSMDLFSLIANSKRDLKKPISFKRVRRGHSVY